MMSEFYTRARDFEFVVLVGLCHEEILVSLGKVSRICLQLKFVFQVDRVSLSGSGSAIEVGSAFNSDVTVFER